MDTARPTTARSRPAPLLEDGLIRAGFLPALPRRARLARRLGAVGRMTAGRTRPVARSAARHAG